MLFLVFHPMDTVFKVECSLTSHIYLHYHYHCKVILIIIVIVMISHS